MLKDLSKLDKKKIKLDKNSNIKFPEFYEIEEVKQIREELKEIGAGNGWLMKNGFVAAGMLLRI